MYSSDNDMIEIVPHDMSVSSGKINYPSDCVVVNLTKNTDIKEKGIKQLNLVYHVLVNTTIYVNIESFPLSCDRSIQANGFYSSGPMTLDGPKTKIYSVKIDERNFKEEDPNNECKMYPNSEFYSYRYI